MAGELRATSRRPSADGAKLSSPHPHCNTLGPVSLRPCRKPEEERRREEEEKRKRRGKEEEEKRKRRGREEKEKRKR